MDEEVLKDYESSLEDLSFNSKPIINMLTMKADKHKEMATQISEMIESRFFKVATSIQSRLLESPSSDIASLVYHVFTTVHYNLLNMCALMTRC